MKIKRFLIAISLLSLLFCSAVFTACKGKFDDVSLTVNSVEEISGESFSCDYTEWYEGADFTTNGYLKLYMQAGEDGKLEYIPFTNEDAENYSEAYFNISVHKLPKGYDGGFSYINSNPTAVNVITTSADDKFIKSNGASHTIKIAAANGGRAVIDFYPNAGGKSKKWSLTVEVICPLESMQLNSGYKPYVVAGSKENGEMLGGESLVLSDSKAFTFVPNISTQKVVDYTFSSSDYTLTENNKGVLVNGALAAEIIGKELFVYNNFEGDQINIIATNSVAKINPYEFKINVKVIHKIQEAFLNYEVDNKYVKGNILLSNNILQEMQKTVQITINNLDNNAKVVFESSNENVFLIEETTVVQDGNKFKFDISSNNEGHANLITKIIYEDINYEYSLSKEVEVENFVDTVNLTGDFTNKLYLYSTYAGDKFAGERITVTTNPKDCFDGRFLVYIPQADQNKINVKVGSTDAQIITNFNSAFYTDLDNKYLYNSGTVFTFTAKSEINKDVKIFFISYHSLNYTNFEAGKLETSVYKPLTISIQKGVEKDSVNFTEYDLLTEKTYLIEKGKSQQIKFDFPSDMNSEYINISFKNMSIVKADNARLYLKDICITDNSTKYVSVNLTGLAQGSTNVYITFANGVQIETTVRCFAGLDGFILKSSKTENNSNVVGKIEYNNDGSLKHLYMARTGEKLAITPALYYLSGGSKVFSNIEYFSIEYSAKDETLSQNSDVASVNARGIIEATKIGKAIIIVSLTYYTENGTSTIETSFTLHVYNPISNIRILDKDNKPINSLTLYQSQQYHFFKSYSEAQVKIQINPTNVAGLEAIKVQNLNSGLILVKQSDFTANEFVISVNPTTNNTNISTSVVFTVQQYSKVYTITLNLDVKDITNTNLIHAESEIYKAYSVNQETPIEDVSLEKITFNENATFKQLLYVFVPEKEDDKDDVEFLLDKNDNQTGVLIAKHAVNGTIYTIAKSLFKYAASGKYSTALGMEELVEKLTGAKTIAEFKQYLVIAIKLAEDSIDESTLRYVENVYFAKTTLEVADGSIEYPYLIRNYQELKNIDLEKHYLLKSDINLYNYNWEPLHKINADGSIAAFTGSINGEYSRFGTVKMYSLEGMNINLTTQEAGKTYYKGLFAINRGTIKNLNITIKNINVNIVSNKKNTIYLGAVCGINEGVINNVNVNIAASSIKIQGVEAYIGAISGTNANSGVKNLKTSGVININEVYNQDIPDTALYLGGLFGKNTSEINLGFKLFGLNGENIFGDDYNSSLELNVVIHSNNNKDVFVGGAIGENTSKVAGILTNGNITISGINNFGTGGVIGKSSGVIDNCFTSGRIYAQSSNLVGGIVGTTTTDITNSTMFIFDMETPTTSIIANINVGAIAGSVVGSDTNKIEFNANYVRSYYSGSETGYFDIIANNNLGALIGNAQYVDMARSYAYVKNIKATATTNNFVGGLIGNATNTKANYVFFKGDLYVNETKQTAVLIGGGNNYILTNSTNYITSCKLGKDSAANWVVDSNYNDGDYITLNDDGKIMSIEAPTQIETNFKTGVSSIDNYLVPTTEIVKTVDNTSYGFKEITSAGYYKVDGDEIKPCLESDTGAKYLEVGNYKIEQIALLYYYNNNISKNTIDLETIVNISTLPNTTNNKFLEYSSSNVNVAKVSGSHIILTGAGETVITVKSKLNLSVSCTFKIMVINALTTFEVCTNQNLENVLANSVNVMEGAKQQLYINCDSKDVLFKISILSGSDCLTLSNGTDFGTYYEYSQLDKILLNFIKEGTAKIKITPIYYVNGVLVELETLSNTEFEFKIYKGLKDAYLDSIEGEIYLDEYIELGINTITHLNTADTYIEAITINEAVQGEHNRDVSELTNLLIVEQVGSENKLGEKTEFIYSINVNREIYNNLLNNGKISNENLILILQVPVYTTSNGVVVNKNLEFTLIVKNQALYNISSKYYGYNQLTSDLYGNTTININEIETDKIVAGEWGLLDIELFPEYADIKNLEFSYTANTSELLSVRQVLYNKESGRYYNYGSTGIVNNDFTILTQNATLSIAKYSTVENISATRDISWNGHIYLSILVKSNASLNTTFTLKLKVINSNNVYKEYTRTLGTTVSTKLSISYMNSTEYGVLVNQVNLNDRVIDRNGKDAPQIMLINVQDIKLNSDYSNLYFVIDGAVVSCTNSLYWAYTGNTQNGKPYQIRLEISNNFIMQSSAQLTLVINSTLPLGEEIKISFKAQTTINQKQVYINSNEMTFVGSLYYITGYMVDGVKNEVFAKAIHSSYYLKVNLFARFSAINAIDARAQINSKEIEISLLVNRTNNYFYGVSTTNVQPQKLTTIHSYNSYSITSESFLHSGTYLEKIKITPKRIHTGDILIFALKVNYGKNVEFDNSGMYYNRSNTITQDASKQTYQIYKTQFTLDFFFNATEEAHAQPIFDAQGLKNMKEDGFYRLEKDIIITEKWNPLDINIRYLDGNGYSIILANGFNIISSSQEEDDEAEEESEGNYGLFATIYEQTVIVNLTVSITSTKQFLDETDGKYKDYLNPTSEHYRKDGYLITNNTFGERLITFNFTSSLADSLNIGLLAGKNEGTIYNCFTTVGSQTVLKYNLNNSLDLNSVQIGGLVGENSGYVSYSKSNMAMFVEEASCSIGGLVATNSGIISNCEYSAYEGIYKSINYYTSSKIEDFASVAGLVAINTRSGEIYQSLTKGNTSVFSSLKAAGFVCSNEGLIENCYSAISIESNLTASGFIYENLGEISHCYSESEVAGNSQMVYAFGYKNTGTIYDCYYKKLEYVNADSFAIEIEPSTFDKSIFEEFLFADDDNSRVGIWYLDGALNKLTLVEENYIANLKTNKGNTSDCFASWILLNSEINENEESYNWAKSEGSDGDRNNPIVIYSEANFNNAFANKLVNYDYVIACDIEFTGIEITSCVRDFEGKLFGNNMTLSEVTLNAASYKNTYFGLFATIKEALVKNLNLEFTEVYANTSNVVGGLAGYIKDSNILDITIGGEDTVIQGINIVGGLAGLIDGSTVKNITTSISINATYAGGEQFMHTLNLQNVDAKNLKASYAGAIAGAVYNTSSTTTTLQNVNVVGNSRVIAYTAASAFGYVGQNTSINYASVLIEPTQYVYTSFVGGGLIGENHGNVKNSWIEYSDPELMNKIDTNLDETIKSSSNNNIDVNIKIDEQDTSFFKNKPLTIGGLIGVNFGGEINNCYTKIDVRQENSIVAGGLIGITVGGTIQNTYATGSVLSKNLTGGLIGSITTLRVVVASLSMGIEQVGTGIYSVSDLYKFEQEITITDGTTIKTVKKYNTNIITDNSPFEVYIVQEDKLENKEGTSFDTPYEIIVNNNMALNNYLSNKQGDFDYENAVYFGTFVGSVYGTYDGTVDHVLDNGTCTVSNNFSYQIENKKDGKSDITYYENHGSVSNLFVGGQAGPKNDNSGNNFGKIYELNVIPATGNAYSGSKVYAITNANDNTKVDYIYINLLDSTSAITGEYLYIYELTDADGNSLAGIYKLEGNSTDDARLEEVVSGGPTINQSGSGDELKIGENVYSLTNINNGVFTSIPTSPTSDVTSEKMDAAMSKFISENVRTDLAISNDSIYVKENEYKIFECDELTITATTSSICINTTSTKIINGVGGNNVDTKEDENGYFNIPDSDAALIVGVINEYLGWGELYGHITSKKELLNALKDYPNQALVRIYVDCNIPDNKLFVIDQSKLTALIKVSNNFYILVDEDGDLLNSKSGTGISLIALTKPLIVSPKFNDRLNTADLFKAIFGENFVSKINGTTQIFPYIDVNLNNEELLPTS